MGGYAGGQAEYARVPFADVGPIKVPEGLTDEQVLFLSDIFPTGYRRRRTATSSRATRSRSGAAGRSGQFAIKSAYLLGAERVIAMDRFPERLRNGRGKCRGRSRSTTRRWTIGVALRDMTGGRGPDACIDAVGMEAHGTSSDAIYDKANATGAPGHGPAQRAAAGDHDVPQGRHRLRFPASTAACWTRSRSARRSPKA